ncbi:MAG: hypothetical protein ACJAZO_001344 [Myxococcota bacterium]|jgi:hypothetical protein
MSEPGTAVEAMVALWTPIFATYAPDLVLGRVFMASVMFAGDADADLRGFTDRFITDVAIRLAVWSANPMTAARNAFGAHYHDADHASVRPVSQRRPCRRILPRDGGRARRWLAAAVSVDVDDHRLGRILRTQMARPG